MYSVNWATRVITIPKADTVLVSSSPDVRSLDVSDLWAALRDIQDDTDGIVNVDIFRNTPPLTVAGVTLARTLEIINGYTITFENLQYSVNIIGGNSNLADVVNKNQVSVNTANSGGLVVVVSGSGLSAEQAEQLRELHLIQGLDPTKPLTTHASCRKIPADGSEIDQVVSENNGYVTIQRQ